jgi:hypothetical protein
MFVQMTEVHTMDFIDLCDPGTGDREAKGTGIKPGYVEEFVA